MPSCKTSTHTHMNVEKETERKWINEPTKNITKFTPEQHDTEASSINTVKLFTSINVVCATIAPMKSKPEAAYGSDFHEKHRNSMQHGFSPGASRAAGKHATNRPLWHISEYIGRAWLHVYVVGCFYFFMLFSSRVSARIRYSSAWSAGGYAYIFVLLSVVTERDTNSHDRINTSALSVLSRVPSWSSSICECSWAIASKPTRSVSQSLSPARHSKRFNTKSELNHRFNSHSTICRKRKTDSRTETSTEMQQDPQKP